MAIITEVAPEVFQISIYVPEINLQFNHFLVRDEQPLLFHAGYKRMFPELHEAVTSLMNPAQLNYVSFSHFESDECGGLNQWLELAPQAETVCGFVGAMVNLNDFAVRPARATTGEERIETGRYRFRFIATPQVPHGWDAGVLFEETNRTLFCSDLFHQWGNMEPLTESSVLGRARDALLQTEAGPLAGYIPYTHRTGRILENLANLEPRTLAIMHGSSFRGDAASELRGLSEIWKVSLGAPDGGQSSAGADASLYRRLGGYDKIAAIVDGTYAELMQDPAFARFSGGRSQDSQRYARQLLVDQVCALAGGPCFYIGRDMKTSHTGLDITTTEWEVSLKHTTTSLRKNGVPDREQAEFLSLFERYRADIVEGR